MISVHWIPTHRGAEDKGRFARWQPPFVKVVCIDERPPYMEDIPAAAKVVIRNHPMSELYGSRGFAVMGAVDGSAELSLVDGVDANETTQIKYELYPWERHDSRYAWARGVEDRTGFTTSKYASSLSNAAGIGTQHAAACQRMAAYCESQGIVRSRLVFEGLNEPQLWANEPPELTAAYYRSFLMSLHSYSLHGVVGNFGVGWPGNGGVQDAPVEWGFFRPVIDIFQPGDYLGLHEYWGLDIEGPAYNWTWWAGRFTQCPFDVPILITECGIDTGVTGQWYGGWYDLPGNSFDEKAVRYVNELWWYSKQCAADGRIKGIFPFTYDIGGNEWEKFDIRSEPFLAAFFAKVDADGMPQPGGVTPPPVDPPAPPVVAGTYRIEGKIVSQAPNEGIAYINGHCQMLDAQGAYVKPMNKVVQARWQGNANEAEWITIKVGPHPGYENWQDGFWSFVPAQIDGQWEVRAVDEFRGISAPWTPISLDAAHGRQAQMLFLWLPNAVTPPVPPEPPVPPVVTVEDIRNAAWNELGIAYNPNAALALAARRMMYGVPMSDEFDVGDYRVQAFAGGILYCKIGDWSNVKGIKW